MQLQVQKGWHIHANPPGDSEFDVPTELAVTSQLGTELTKIRYPAGQKVPRGEDEKPMLQYTGTVGILGQLEVPADVAGGEEELTIDVTYQACDDAKCLPPKTLKVKLPVRVAAKGEVPKAINDKLFNPPGKK